jgi:XTP/dITP diphosphohydrolase
LTLFLGRWHGEIRRERAGAAGFGYDPYFWVAGAGRPDDGGLAGARREERAARTRGLAVRRLVEGLAGLD